MLAAEALRLAAIEILRPTAAVEAGTGFPTLAGLNVLDSRETAVEDIDRSKPYTPILALHTTEAGVALRGPLSSANDVSADTVLDVVAELAVVEQDGQGEFAFAAATTDPEARLVLAALCAQVRYLLERSQSGGMWRYLVQRIVNIEYQSFAAPEIGVRIQRTTMRFHCEIRDDDFEVVGLPEPLATIYAKLPAQSYAKAKLAALASHFSPDVLPSLDRVTIDTGPNFPGAQVNFP
ncbi:hypothetical protein AS026_21190 [Rhizobium altiplani]|uniref:Uncharacterized protein n=1 Tax=Rhizobium altiplani TaxID=1864509 RepID=A0A125Q4N0_9HYPH|nr:hypothetical protein [Rhizobium altiplani]KWV42126.1 hypothetical protein AS026_21190 [Rhizobium altiplani]